MAHGLFCQFLVLLRRLFPYLGPIFGPSWTHKKKRVNFVKKRRFLQISAVMLFVSFSLLCDALFSPSLEPSLFRWNLRFFVKVFLSFVRAFSLSLDSSFFVRVFLSSSSLESSSSSFFSSSLFFVRVFLCFLRAFFFVRVSSSSLKLLSFVRDFSFVRVFSSSSSSLESSSSSFSLLSSSSSESSSSSLESPLLR